MILPRQCLSSKRVRDRVADVGQLYDSVSMVTDKNVVIGPVLVLNLGMT